MSDFEFKINKKESEVEVSVSLTSVFPGSKSSKAYSTHDAAKALDAFLERKKFKRGDVKVPGFASNFGSKADLNTTWVFELMEVENVNKSRVERENKKLQKRSKK